MRWGGDWIEIENPQDVPDLFIKVYKEPIDGLYRCDGIFYFTEDEDEDEDEDE